MFTLHLLKPSVYLYTDTYLTIQYMLTLHLKPWVYLYTDTYLTIQYILTLHLKPWVYCMQKHILNSPLDGYQAMFQFTTLTILARRADYIILNEIYLLFLKPKILQGFLGFKVGLALFQNRPFLFEGYRSLEYHGLGLLQSQKKYLIGKDIPSIRTHRPGRSTILQKYVKITQYLANFRIYLMLEIPVNCQKMRGYNVFNVKSTYLYICTLYTVKCTVYNVQCLISLLFLDIWLVCLYPIIVNKVKPIRPTFVVTYHFFDKFSFGN